MQWHELVFINSPGGEGPKRDIFGELMAYGFLRGSNLLIDGLNTHFDNFGWCRPLPPVRNLDLLLQI